MWFEYGLKELQPKTIESFYNSLNIQQRMEVYKRMEEMPDWNVQNLDESKNLGDLYHFTNLENLNNILESNLFLPSTTPTYDHQRDFQSIPKEKRQRLKDKGETSLYYVSLSRDKLFYKKHTKIGTLPLTRIKFDGNKLSTKYKFIPFNYYSDEIDSEQERYNSNEGEERIILPNGKGIQNINNYIIKIDILLDKIEDNETYLKQAEELIKKYPNITLLYKEKPTTMEGYKKTILPTIEPYRDEEFLEVIDKTLNEIFTPQNHQPILDQAVEWGCSYLQIEKPQINFINDPNYVQQHSSFGGYNPGDKSIIVSVYNRNTADICRSTFHEMIHAKQDVEGRLNLEAGKDGDPYENEANAIAAKMMRKLGRELPEIFEIENNINEIKINNPNSYKIINLYNLMEKIDNLLINKGNIYPNKVANIGNKYEDIMDNTIVYNNTKEENIKLFKDNKIKPFEVDALYKSFMEIYNKLLKL
jgi:hypothetical protein